MVRRKEHQRLVLIFAKNLCKLPFELDIDAEILYNQGRLDNSYARMLKRFSSAHLLARKNSMQPLQVPEQHQLPPTQARQKPSPVAKEIAITMTMTASGNRNSSSAPASDKMSTTPIVPMVPQVAPTRAIFDNRTTVVQQPETHVVETAKAPHKPAQTKNENVPAATKLRVNVGNYTKARPPSIQIPDPDNEYAYKHTQLPKQPQPLLQKQQQQQQQQAVMSKSSTISTHTTTTTAVTTATNTLPTATLATETSSDNDKTTSSGSASEQQHQMMLRRMICNGSTAVVSKTARYNRSSSLNMASDVQSTEASQESTTDRKAAVSSLPPRPTTTAAATTMPAVSAAALNVGAVGVGVGIGIGIGISSAVSVASSTSQQQQHPRHNNHVQSQPVTLSVM